MSIEKVAVIGAGVMGAGIAAHIANAGIPVDLLDLAPKTDSNRNAIAEHAIARMLKTEPAPFMHARNARLVTPGNIEDHLDKVAQVDWIIEAVIENPTIKQDLYRQLSGHCRSDTLISSNTSTLPLSVLTADQPDSFKRRFMITHFFNPPRYMRLLELVATPELDASILKEVRDFADRRLGKGCVLCKDTPGFIANRIGTFWLQTALREAAARDLSVEQCDAVMMLFGLPKTGVFGLLDLIGLDLIPHVLASFKQSLPRTDRLIAIAEVAPILKDMIERGLIGRKGDGGFYRLNKNNGQKIKQSINLNSGAYQPSQKFKIDPAPKSTRDLQAFLSADNPLSQYAWQVWSDTLCYTAGLIPAIADDINAVDTAMRLGYNWRYGPFELIDRLEAAWFAERLAQENRDIPDLLENRLPMYRTENSVLACKDPGNRYHPVKEPEGVLSLTALKRKASALLSNNSASLWDAGDGVACFEFHSKLNTLDPDTLNLLGESVERVKRDFTALVIYNEAEHFSAGANLTLLAPALMQQDWTSVTGIIRLGQETYRALKYAPFPVVGAPSGMALGGGCEILLHCDAIQAYAELYIGLVEVGVGLVPGWGGCKELLGRWLSLTRRPGGPMPAIAQTFETIALAKVSKSAQEAQDLLYIAKTDGITMNRDRLLADAKARALSLASDYQPPEAHVFMLPGASAAAALDIAAHNLQLAGKATRYDAVIARQLAMILSGGETDMIEPLSEQQLLDLELSAFLHLVKQPATQARLEHMLKTGKPLRN